MRSGKPRRLAAFVATAILAGSSLAFAQFIYRGGGGFRRSSPKWAREDSFDGSFNYCRGYFTRVRYEDGGSGSDTDYPAADNNFSVRLGELTKTPIKMDAEGQPDFVVVRMTDPWLFHCPLVYMEDVGTAHFSPEEADGLRAYLLKGGLLEVDDFWGTEAWNTWVDEIGRVLPPNEFPIFDIPLTHPILHMMYDIKAVEQVSSINFWSRSGGSTSERGWDSPHPDFRGIADARGRLLVVMAHNTDIPDTWEREGESAEYFARFSPDGYALGINIALYAMTH